MAEHNIGHEALGVAPVLKVPGKSQDGVPMRSGAGIAVMREVHKPARVVGARGDNGFGDGLPVAATAVNTVEHDHRPGGRTCADACGCECQSDRKATILALSFLIYGDPLLVDEV